MLKNIIKGYSQILISILKVLILLLICAGTGAAFVFPLWFFATEFPHSYTYSVLALVAALFAFYIIKHIINSGIKSTVISLLKLFIIAAGLFGFVMLVLNGMRLLTIPLLIVVFFLYGLCSFVFKTSTQKEDEDESVEE